MRELYGRRITGPVADKMIKEPVEAKHGMESTQGDTGQQQRDKKRRRNKGKG